MTFFFENQKVDISEADFASLGFVHDGGCYRASFAIMDADLEVCVTVSDHVDTVVIDKNTGDQYTLYKLTTLHSGFAYEVKIAVEEKLTSLFGPFLTRPDKFPSRQFSFLEAALYDAYGDVTDPPFNDFLAYVFRYPSNRKWYGLAMMVAPDKLGLPGEKDIPIILIRCEKDKSSEYVNYDSIFPAYHMHKSSWITIPLDYKVNDDDLLRLLKASRAIVGKK